MTTWAVEREMHDRPGRRAVSARAGNPRCRVAAAVARMSWAYLIVLLALWAFLRLEGDRWWLGTVMLFGPVWVVTLPLAVLVPGALLFRRRSLPILLAAAAISLFCLMGVCFPWRTYLHGRCGGHALRLLTCNVHGKSALNKLISANDPDIVILQEWPGSKESPAANFGEWYTRQDGELLIASRYPILKTEVFTGTTWSDWGGSAARYDIAAPGGLLQLFNIHLASPHRPFDAVMAGKPEATRRLEEYLAVRLAQSGFVNQLAASAGNGVIVAGDFNTPCEGRVYHTLWSDYSDAFTTAGLGLGHTYFAHGAAVRIDHILSGSGWHCGDCRVGAFVGSPHRPVIAELARVAAGE
jgi:endonuclease/exonuclease/phosphatase (EEP) superfamily protein YafD